LERSRHVRVFRTIVSLIFIAGASSVLVPGRISAEPADNVAVDTTTPQGAGRLPVDRNALFACIGVTEPGAHGDGDDLSGATAQLRNSDNRIDGRDWSGQDLSGKNFSGKVFAGVKLKGTNLQGADLTDAIICGSDLSGADLSGAHLDRVLIGGETMLDGANLTKVSGHALEIADASALNIRIDGADLRGARLICDEWPRCLGNGVQFSSMIGADLRGATIDNLWAAPPSLGTAHLDQVTTSLNGAVDLDLVQLANGVGDSGRITFIPWYGHSGVKTEFTGTELRELAKILRQMQSTSAHPSFDCSRAKPGVEKAICGDPKLAALDSAMNWLWQRIEHTPEQVAAQKTWINTRTTCPPADYYSSSDPLSAGSLASFVDPKGCIGIAYAERIRQLASKSSSAVVGSGTYTTDSPLELPRGQHSTLVRKFLRARGYREDGIVVENLGNGSGKISGHGSWANGHECSFETSEAQTQRMGARFRIDDGAPDHDENYSVSFAITPQVVIRAGGARQFQCGARGGWSDVYFRQPDDLISSAKGIFQAAH
jgi:uncharacterized protein YjbI with pentapeptide repeats/uncharacterized protein